MFGISSYEQCRHNRLAAHLDLVASFLYSADHATYNLSAPLNSQDELVQQASAIGDYWNQKFRDSGIAYTYATALLWSLVNDTSIMKLGWNDARTRLTGEYVMPHQFGVYDETRCDLDSQEAFCHVYRLHYDEACARLIRAGMKDEIEKLGIKQGSPTDDMPPVLKNLILTSQGSTNLSANIMGSAPFDNEPRLTYEAKSDIPTVEFHELWVWDTLEEDYITFIIAEPDIILADSRETIRKLEEKGERSKTSYESKTNLFFPDTTPFVQITPFPLPDYFWGESHCERLIPLQDWTNERLNQIAEIMEQQVSPPKVFSGFMGLADEKAAAFGGPDSWVLDALPQAKVEPLRPTMPDDLFAEYTAIGQIFLEASGLTETVTGKGESGVRGKGHAKQLATTGSARIRKTAVGLEPGLVEIGDLGLRLCMHNDKDALAIQSGMKMLPAQFGAENWGLTIAGHSHSPLFLDEGRELAQLLLRSAAIDREMFIRLLHPPQRDTMISQLRKRTIAELQARASGMLPAPGQKPNGKSKGHSNAQEAP